MVGVVGGGVSTWTAEAQRAGTWVVETCRRIAVAKIRDHQACVPAGVSAFSEVKYRRGRESARALGSLAPLLMHLAAWAGWAASDACTAPVLGAGDACAAGITRPSPD